MCVNHTLLGFYLRQFVWTYGFNSTLLNSPYTIKSLLLLKKLFYLLLYLDFFTSWYFLFWYSFSFASFLQTYYDIYSFHILSFYFYLLQISFYIYFLLAPLIFLYHSHNNLLLYLVLVLCFSDNKLCYLFFIYNEKKL